MTDSLVTPSPEWAEVLRLVVQRAQAQIRIAFPGKIEKWDPVTQKVDVLPLIKEVTITDERNRLVEPLPVLQNVPVRFPRTSTGFMSFPLKVGDHVQIQINDRSIDQFMARDGSLTDPLDNSRHTLSGAIAVPGLYPDSKALKEVDPNNIVIGFDSGGAQIHVKPDGTFEHRVSGQAAEVVVKGNAYKATYDVHAHTSPFGLTGAPSTPMPATDLSTVVKINDG